MLFWLSLDCFCTADRFIFLVVPGDAAIGILPFALEEIKVISSGIKILGYRGT